MGAWQRRLRRLVTTEEIPRAIGLMLVLVFVIAVGGVSLVTYLHQQSVARAQLVSSLQKAVELLADRVTSAPERADENPLLLSQFAARYPCIGLRVYNRQEVVLASLHRSEVGKLRPPQQSVLKEFPNEVQMGWVRTLDGQPERLLVRAPARHVGAAEQVYIDALLAPDEVAVGGPFPATAMSVAAAATAALLVVYRRLRRGMATVTRIAESLLQNSAHLAEALPDLRIANVQDRIGECWNSFVDLACRLDEEVSRSNASSELLAALSRSDAGELAGAMMSAPLGVVLATDQGVVLYANAMARRLVGWPLDAAAAITLGDENMLPDGRRLIDCVHNCSTGGVPARAVDTQVEGVDGSYYQVKVIPARSSQQSSRLLVLVNDVSQQVRADKAREEFVSQVTHELRTPLTNIRAYTETLSSGQFDDPQVITECYNVITKETRRLARLVEDILSISQLEVGTMKLVVDSVDLRTLLGEAVRDVRGIAESKNIELNLVLPAKLGAIKADRDKLAVVVNNLLGNALKYTPAGGQVTLSCKATEAQVQISVRDNGIGIDPKDHGRIFEKFQRADDEAVRAETGTGIGLTTAREIMQQHGGDITVMSRKGEGATFTATLPVSAPVHKTPVAVAL